jgi:hypothetical protein
MVNRRRRLSTPASLVESHLATLEPLQPDEPGFRIDATRSAAAAAEAIR